MNFIDATTKHSRREEKDFARVLYIAIVLAVLAGMIVFFVVGQKSSFNPKVRSEPAPAVTPSGDR